MDWLEPESRARIEKLLAKRWSPPGEHPLARLHELALEAHRLFVLLGPKNNVGSRYFQLFLADRRGRLAEPALALGLHGSGPFPAYNWVELTRYEPVQVFGDHTVDLAAGGLDLRLFAALSDLVPPGGHLMVEYDSPDQRATAQALTLGYPAAVSHLGYVLFRAGCRSYRDWYISEGGREGPRKLQAFKPLNGEIAREKTEALRRELRAFLARPTSPQHADIDAACRRRGRDVLRSLGE